MNLQELKQNLEDIKEQADTIEQSIGADKNYLNFIRAKRLAANIDVLLGMIELSGIEV